MKSVNESAFLYECNACGKPCTLLVNDGKVPAGCPFDETTLGSKADWKEVGRLLDPHKQFEIIIQDC